MGIEPTPSAWKAEVLPLNYTRAPLKNLVEGEGFEPSKAKPPDLQSGPFDRSGTPPNFSSFFNSVPLSSMALRTGLPSMGKPFAGKKLRFFIIPTYPLGVDPLKFHFNFFK